MEFPEAYKEELAAYFVVLGEFVHHFSYMEGRLQHLLWQASGSTPEIAKIIFPGTRVHICAQHIGKIRAATNATQSPYLDKAFAHIPIVNNIRNDILHYGTQFTFLGTDPYVTTARGAQEGNERVTKMNPAILKNLIEDIHTIICCLNMHEFSLLPPEVHGSPIWKELADRAWLYKPTQPIVQKKPSHGKNPKPSHQQKPSEG